MTTHNPRPPKTFRYPDRAGPPVELPPVLAYSLGLPLADAAQARSYAVSMHDLSAATAGIRVDLTHNGRHYYVKIDPTTADCAVFRQEQLARTRLDSGTLRKQLVAEAMETLAKAVDAGVAKR